VKVKFGAHICIALGGSHVYQVLAFYSKCLYMFPTHKPCCRHTSYYI